MGKAKISKSRYLKGLQCPKLLWWSVNEPDSKELEPDLLTQHRFDVGNQVGELARTLYENGVLVEDKKDFTKWLKNTKEAIEAGQTVIYEAAFTTEQVFAAIDILEYSEQGWNVVEVKSSLDVKDSYINDLAIQVWVLQKCGLNINKIQILTLNRNYKHPEGDLFSKHDVTEKVLQRQLEVPANVSRFAKTIDGDLPEYKTGKHCKSPYPCPFKDRCFRLRSKHHISTLYRIDEDKVSEYEQNGIIEVGNLSNQSELSKIQKRQFEAVKNNKVVVEPSLKRELSKIIYPIAYLDFETIMPAVPLYDGDKPYQTVPVQFSCHLEQESGEMVHYEWIASKGQDPRTEMAVNLLTACESANTIIAYNAKFEKYCIELIAQKAADLADRLINLNGKFIDLLPIVRNHAYHPEFMGSFSLKKVLPALVEELNHGDLEVQDGMTASILLERALSGTTDFDEKIRQNLLNYCRLDTLAMQRLLLKLRDL